MRKRSIVIVGGGLAGAKAAESARAAGFDGRIVLVGDERHAPYERPPLSKAVLRGEAEPASTEVHPDGFYDDHDVELVTGVAVLDVDVAGRTVHLAGGRRLRFDRLLLATGAEPRRLQVPGADLAGVHPLRTLDDALALRAAILDAAHVAVVGAGWIGSEVAASARELGREVVLINPGSVPLRRVLGDRVGQVFADLHAGHGVDLRMGAGVTELRGAGTVEEVVLSTGDVIAADVVVAGIGVRPRTELAEAAGLAVDNGIVVDELLETSAPGVFAAGDVAAAWHPHFAARLRVEHWANALNQGITAGHNLADGGEAYTRLPYFYSDQYDLGMEYVGYADGRDHVVVRGDVDGRKFVAFWLREGRVAAAMNVNIWDGLDELKRLIDTGAIVDDAQLLDEAVPLTEIGVR